MLAPILFIWKNLRIDVNFCKCLVKLLLHPTDLASTSQDCQGHEKQGKTQKLVIDQWTVEKRQLNAMYPG